VPLPGLSRTTLAGERTVRRCRVRPRAGLRRNCAVHLIGALVAGQGLGRADGVAERAVEGGGIFCRIGHDLHVEKSGSVQPRGWRRRGRPSCRGGDDVAAGFGLHQRLAHQHRDGLVVEDPAVLDQAVMPWLVKGSSATSQSTPRPGNSFLIARTDWQTRLSELAPPSRARRATKARIGKQRDAGNVQLTARSASRTT